MTLYRLRIEMLSEAEIYVEAESALAAQEQAERDGWGDANFDLVESYVAEATVGGEPPASDLTEQQPRPATVTP